MFRGSGGGSRTIGNRRKKRCEHGSSCKYKQEHQHAAEYFHEDEESDPSNQSNQRKKFQSKKQKKFLGEGHKLVVESSESEKEKKCSYCKRAGHNILKCTAPGADAEVRRRNARKEKTKSRSSVVEKFEDQKIFKDHSENNASFPNPYKLYGNDIPKQETKTRSSVVENSDIYEDEKIFHFNDESNSNANFPNPYKLYGNDAPNPRRESSVQEIIQRQNLEYEQSLLADEEKVKMEEILQKAKESEGKFKNCSLNCSYQSLERT